MRVAWITGAGGLIGSHLLRAAAVHAPTWRVEGLTRSRLDLTEGAAVTDAFRRSPPDLVLHAAALSKSPACQEQPDLARRLNVEVTARLSDLARDIPFVLLSTDLVFDGRDGGYDEDAAPRPTGVYGETKLEAERIVLANPRHTVVRTSLNGGISPTGDRGFNEELRRAWLAGRPTRLFTDEFRCPLPASVTARAIWELVASGRPGLFHLAGAERLSRWQIGERVAVRWPQLRPRLEAASLRDHRGAPRPPDTSLRCGRLQALLSFPLPGLTAWLAAHPEDPF